VTQAWLPRRYYAPSRCPIHAWRRMSVPRRAAARRRFPVPLRCNRSPSIHRRGAMLRESTVSVPLVAIAPRRDGGGRRWAPSRCSASHLRRRPVSSARLDTAPPTGATPREPPRPGSAPHNNNARGACILQCLPPQAPRRRAGEGIVDARFARAVSVLRCAGAAAVQSVALDTPARRDVARKHRVGAFGRHRAARRRRRATVGTVTVLCVAFAAAACIECAIEPAAAGHPRHHHHRHSFARPCVCPPAALCRQPPHPVDWPDARLRYRDRRQRTRRGRDSA
jgi:hypothetical protein